MFCDVHKGIEMTLVTRSLLAGLAVVASAAGAFAADLNGGSIKDSGYNPATSTRPALFYVRGDFTLSSNDFGSYTELPNYTQSYVGLGRNRSIGGGFGYYFSPNIRGDLTLDGSSSANAHGSVLDGAATVQGERRFGIKSTVGLANLYYDFDNRGRFTPYLGVGLGFARNTTTAGTVTIAGCDTGSTGAPNCAAAMEGTTKTNAAGALMAGFSAKLGDRWNLDAGYRFLYLGDAKTGDINITRAAPVVGAPNSTSGVTVHDLYAHQFRVGMRMDVR
jgi:opacity protein-like surface antigen